MKTRALVVLAAIFFASFLGRIAVLAADAKDGAKSAPETALDASKTIAPVNAPAAPQKNAAAPGACLGPEVAEAVKHRLDALDKDEAALAERRSELKAYEMQIEKRLAELKQANTVFSAAVAAKQAQRNADIAKLAAIYEGMKPAQASTIITEMDPKFAAGLLGAMSAEQAAQIVAAMDSEKAYLVSVILANQSQAH